MPDTGRALACDFSCLCAGNEQWRPHDSHPSHCECLVPKSRPCGAVLPHRALAQLPVSCLDLQQRPMCDLYDTCQVLLTLKIAVIRYVFFCGIIAHAATYLTARKGCVLRFRVYKCTRGCLSPSTVTVVAGWSYFCLRSICSKKCQSTCSW